MPLHPRFFSLFAVVALITTPLCYGPSRSSSSLSGAKLEKVVRGAPRKPKNRGRLPVKGRSFIFFDADGKNVCIPENDPCIRLFSLLFAQKEDELAAADADKENRLPGESRPSPVPGRTASLPQQSTPSPTPDLHQMPVDAPARPASSTPPILLVPNNPHPNDLVDAFNHLSSQ